MRGCVVATLVVFALWLSGTARAQGSDWPEPLPAQASAQQATTEQAGMASADAADPQPTNIFVSLRINSPGDNGPVTQTATTAVAGDTANNAATAQEAAQDWAPGAHAAQQASAQDSGTTQAAATSATARRPKPTNVVLSVRVASPGDDGPVTQSSTVAVAAQSKNTAATAQKAQQAGTAPAVAAPAAPGAVADRPADPPAPISCVNVAPGTDATRIVITLGKSCRHVAPRRAAAAPKTHETPVRAAPSPSPAPPPAAAPPVVHAAPAVSPAPPASPPPPASSPPRVALEPRPAPPTPRLHVDPLAASTRVADLVAAVPVPRAGEAQYEVMLALLLAMLGAAAVWSYGGAHRYRRWR